MSVAEPLVQAEAAFILGAVARAESFLETASGAIAGAPFLELDWRIELLRARIANHRRDVRGARFYLQRSLHARDLLVERLPASARRSFLSHPRFHGLAEAEIRWRNTPGTVHSTEALRRSAAFEGMVGVSSPMIRIFQTIQRAADVEVPVLIVGETGTGKELAARAIHRLSARSKGPFLVLDCASLPGQLFESELFGAAAGAYTGAERDRSGLLESVAGGTLLLDEVAHLPVEAQAKLLHVLDTGSFRRLGGVEARQSDVRFLASTSLPLEEALRDGRIRADVYYRLRALEVRMPPLRDRREDIVSLARHFLEKHARRLGLPVPEVSPEAIETLESYSWPGNVRELENALLRAVVGRPSGHRIRRADLEPSLTASGEPLFNERLIERHDLGELRAALERQYLTRLFLSTGGDLGRMLEKLHVKRTWLYVWLRRLGLDIKALRERVRRDRKD